MSGARRRGIALALAGSVLASAAGACRDRPAEPAGDAGPAAGETAGQTPSAPAARQTAGPPAAAPAAGPSPAPIAESPPPQLPPEAAALLGRLEALRRVHQEEGLALARAYLAEHPGTPRLHYAIGVLLGSKEDHRAAIAEFERELAADPGHFESHRGMAAAWMRLGQPAAALPHLETCLAMRPGHAETRFQVGRVLSVMARFDEAEAHLAAAAAERDDADGWGELGLLHRRRGDLEAAIADFRRALERDPRHSASLLNLGQLLIRTGAAEEGAALLERHRQVSLLEDRLDHLERSSRLTGATAANFAALADAQLRLGRKDEAIASYRRALELDPEHALAALGLASLLLERGQVEEATRWSVVALMEAPDSLRTHYVLGMVRLAKGQYDEADRAFEASRQRGEWGVEAHLRIAEAYLGAGELDRAARELDRAAAAAPGDPRIPGLRDRLARAREATGAPSREG